MVLAAKAVKEEADAVLSAGNTGALLAEDSSLWVQKKNIDRPGLSVYSCRPLDGKAAWHARPRSHCGKYSPAPPSIRCPRFFLCENKNCGISKPRVGLLNNGTGRQQVGDPLRKETYDLLLVADESLNFVGNVEARDLMNGVADVVVTDGFTGNAVLKIHWRDSHGELLWPAQDSYYRWWWSSSEARCSSSRIVSRLEDTAQLFRCWWAVLFGVKAPVVKLMARWCHCVIVRDWVRIRTMLETDGVALNCVNFQRIKRWQKKKFWPYCNHYPRATGRRLCRNRGLEFERRSRCGPQWIDGVCLDTRRWIGIEITDKEWSNFKV